MTASKVHRCRILVVDDEPLIRWSLREGLNGEGYEILEAGDRREALQRVTDAEGQVELALLDVRLPDSTDLGLLARIKELSPGCRVILITAHGTPELAKQAAELGAFRVLGKPFDIREVVSLVGEALA